MARVSGRRRPVVRRVLLKYGLTAAMLACIVGCRAGDYRRDADKVAYNAISRAQTDALGRTEAFTIETPAETLRRRLLLDQNLPHVGQASLNVRDVDPIRQWPDDDYLTRETPPDEFRNALVTAEPLHLSLTDTLRIAAAESREFQTQKESVFRTALQLDLEADAFRRTWTGVVESMFEDRLEQEIALDDEGHTDRQPISGLENTGTLSLARRFKNGLSFTGRIGLDLVSLLTQKRPFSRGIYADVSATLPLLRGAGEFIVTEPLTQAERNVVYAIYNFERFKRQFAVDIASDYLAVLRQLDSVDNAEKNYRRLIESTRRARRLADAGRLPEIQVDQSRQDELRARNQWVSSQESYKRQLDSFKLRLGLPTDTPLELERGELETVREARRDLVAAAVADSQPAETLSADAPIVLVEPGHGEPGPYELDELAAIVTALQNRLDLRVAVGQVDDAQRTVAVAADQLRADITLLGTGSAGARRTLSSADQDDAILRPDEGTYSALLTIDLPFERTAERNLYRSSLIALEQAVRDAQELEDQVKLDVRNGLSRLLEARESIRIQAESVVVADRRVASTSLFLEAGRAEIRDVLEAQDALVNAQNALTAALVNYRINELALQRDLGVLEVNELGLWREYNPEKREISDDE